jgi:hypothetical protein
MKMDLHYGKDMLCLQIPEANIEEIIRPWQSDQPGDNRTCLQQASNAIAYIVSREAYLVSRFTLNASRFTHVASRFTLHA